MNLQKTKATSEGSSPPLVSLFRELISSFNGMLRGEVELAKAELKTGATAFRRDMFRFMSFSALAAAGLLPLMAFLVLGLGHLLGDNYLWSSLIIAVLSIAIGLGVSYHAYRRATREDLQLPRTLHSVEERLDSLNKRLNELAETTKRSTA